MAAMGLGLGAVAFTPWFAVALVWLVVGGLGDAFAEVAAQAIAQRRAPDELRARVLGTINAAGTAALALSFPFAGLLIELLGVRGVWAFSGVCGLVAAVLLLPVARRLDLAHTVDQAQ